MYIVLPHSYSASCFIGRRGSYRQEGGVVAVVEPALVFANDKVVMRELSDSARARILQPASLK